MKIELDIVNGLVAVAGFGTATIIMDSEADIQDYLKDSPTVCLGFEVSEAEALEVLALGYAIKGYTAPALHKAEKCEKQYKLDVEKWGNCAYFSESEKAQFLLDMEESMFPQSVIRQTYLDRTADLEPSEIDFTEQDIAQEFRDELEDAIEELETDNVRIIFDNAGGMILQLKSWAHYYNGQDSQIANDLIGWLCDGNTDDWEGHEPEALDIDVDVPYGYRVVNIDHDTLRDLLADLIKESWCSDDLIKALAARL